MNDRNSTYRKSFTNVEETSEEYEKKLQLEEQLRVATDKLKYKKRQMKELQEDLRTMQATAESLTVDENELVVIVEEKQRTIDSLQKELDVQEEKKERADKLVRKIKREVKVSGNKKLAVFTAGEEDIKARELRDFNNSLMKKLGIVCRDYPDIAPILNMYCQQVGLPQPPSPGPTSGSSSRASSIASSAGSVRSNLSSARSSMMSFRSDAGSANGGGRQALGTASVDLSLNAFSSSHTPLGTPPRSNASSRASSGKSTPLGSATPTRGLSSSASSSRQSPTKKTPTPKSGSRPPSGRSSTTSSKR